jgi:small subunit ribosomal protein S11
MSAVPAARRLMVGFSFRPIHNATRISGFGHCSRRWLTNAPGDSDIGINKHTTVTGNENPTATQDTTEKPVGASPDANSGYSGIAALLASTPYQPRRASPSTVYDMPPITIDPDHDLANLSLPSLTSMAPQDEEYYFHVLSTKHNTHITFTRPDKGAIVSLSAGNLGFKKAQRGTYDAAYQLAAHVFKDIENKGIKPRSVEVLLRGFGQGREAVTKALLGQEGRFLRPIVKRVTDSTRLKFGGTRSKKPRRLG